MIDLKKFNHLVNLRKVNKDINDHIENSSWDKSKAVLMSIESFNPLHAVDSGRNGASTLLELQTVLRDVVEFKLKRGFSTEHLHLYVKSSATIGQAGFGSDEYLALELKGPDNKLHTIRYQPRSFRRHTEDKSEGIDGLQRVFGCAFKHPLLEDETEEERNTRILRLYQRLLDSAAGYHKEDFIDFITERGYRLVDSYRYDFNIWFKPSYITQNSRTLEVGYMSFGTYNSLPVVIKISKQSEIKTCSLRDIGVEDAGYYSGSDRMTCRPEQLEQVKAFNRRFKTKTKK